jgi:hypothetical protein
MKPFASFIALSAATAASQSLGSPTQTAVLSEIRACHQALPRYADKPFESPCGFKSDVSTLKGISYMQLLDALGPPDTCYVADGDWHLPKDAKCRKGAAPGWAFFRLCFDCMGGGPYFLCRLDESSRCNVPFWRGTK